jgi:hypothetical protein
MSPLHYWLVAGNGKYRDKIVQIHENRCMESFSYFRKGEVFSLGRFRRDFLKMPQGWRGGGGRINCFCVHPM